MLQWHLLKLHWLLLQKTSSIRNRWFLASQPVSNQRSETEAPASQFPKFSTSACKVCGGSCHHGVPPPLVLNAGISTHSGCCYGPLCLATAAATPLGLENAEDSAPSMSKRKESGRSLHPPHRIVSLWSKCCPPLSESGGSEGEQPSDMVRHPIPSLELSAP